MVRRRDFLLLGSAYIVGSIFPAMAAEGGRPSNVLIATVKVRGEGISGKLRDQFDEVYNTYLSLVIKALVEEFRALGVRTAVYVHDDPSTGSRSSVMNRLVSGRHDALVQLRYEFESGQKGNRTLLLCSYMKLYDTGIVRDGGRVQNFGDALERWYVVSSASGEGPDASAVANDFVTRLNKANFASVR